MKIYGHEIELTEPDSNEYATDVMILARVISHDSNGKLQDAVLITTTDSTTGMIQRGMLLEAMDSFVDNLEDDR